MPKKKAGKKQFSTVQLTVIGLIPIPMFLMFHYMVTGDATLLHWSIGLLERVTKLATAIRA